MRSKFASFGILLDRRFAVSPPMFMGTLGGGNGPVSATHPSLNSHFSPPVHHQQEEGLETPIAAGDSEQGSRAAFAYLPSK